MAVFVLVSNQFWKCFSVNTGVWLRMKNKFSKNFFSWSCILMALTRKLVSAKSFTSNHFQTHAQRERERERERKKREPRSCHRLRRSTNPRTNLRPTSLRLRRRPKAFAPQTHEPISLSLWFWFFTFSLWSLIFLLLLWWCFGGFPVVWWWVLCGWWWWKIAFSKCYQTHENIF